jgi:Flp pilus assembly protein TadG
MTPMPEAGAQEAPIAHRRALSPRRRRLRRGKGQAMVEFALIAPAGFLLLLSILVVGIIVTNYIQLANAARDGARIAAICGSSTSATMPDNSGACTPASVSAYITAHLVALPAGSVTPQIYFCTTSDVQSGTCVNSANLLSNSATAFTQCQTGAIFEVDMYYDQPLYVPLVGNFFQTSPNNTRRLTASAEATCEQ